MKERVKKKKEGQISHPNIRVAQRVPLRIWLNLTRLLTLELVFVQFYYIITIYFKCKYDDLFK